MRNDLCRQHGVCQRATYAHAGRRAGLLENARARAGWLALLSFTATSGRITLPPATRIKYSNGSFVLKALAMIDGIRSCRPRMNSRSSKRTARAE